ncbi:MAG: major capsid protein [Sphingomicrobium sp.]
MAVQGSGVTTLMDVLTELAPDGKQLDIAEILTLQNPMLEDIHWEAGNMVTGHKDGARTSLPTPSFRALNAGVPVTKPGSTQIEETCALLEDFSQVDRELALLAGDVNAYRLKQAKPHVQGMSNKMATTLFYGNALANPLEFTGVANRLNTKVTTTNKAAANVIDAGGTGSDLRSIWLIGWGPDTVFGIYPKNTTGGLQHEDATNGTGDQIAGAPPATVLTDASGNMYMGYRDHWVWRCGLFVKDWRYLVRIANIDLTALTITGASGPLLEDLMVQAAEQIESLDGVNAVFYVPRAVRAFFRRQLLQRKNQFLSWDEIGGKRIMSFNEVPVRRTDALNVSETQVV